MCLIGVYQVFTRTIFICNVTIFPELKPRKLLNHKMEFVGFQTDLKWHFQCLLSILKLCVCVRVCGACVWCVYVVRVCGACVCMCVWCVCMCVCCVCGKKTTKCN